MSHLPYTKGRGPISLEKAIEKLGMEVIIGALRPLLEQTPDKEGDYIVHTKYRLDKDTFVADAIVGMEGGLLLLKIGSFIEVEVNDKLLYALTERAGRHLV